MSSTGIHGFCAPYTVRMTPHKGRGVFAEAAIPRGATIWRYVAGQFEVYGEQEFILLLSKLPDEEAVYLLTHVVCMPEFPDHVIRVFDDGELINHSNDPTLIPLTASGYDMEPSVASTAEVAHAMMGDHFTLVAARDIERGEELTLDYNDDPDGPPFYDRLCEQYGVTWDWL